MEDTAQTTEAPDMVVAFRLTPDEHDAFRRACRDEQRSMSGQLRVLVRDWLRTRDDDTTELAA